MTMSKVDRFTAASASTQRQQPRQEQMTIMMMMMMWSEFNNATITKAARDHESPTSRLMIDVHAYYAA